MTNVNDDTELQDDSSQTRSRTTTIFKNHLFPYLVVFLAAGFILMDPVAAAESGSPGATAGSGLCSTDGAAKLINTGFQAMFSLGVLGAILSSQYNRVIGIFNPSQETRKQLKKREGAVKKNTAWLFGLPVLVKVFGPSAGITFASCLDITPLI